ncbi:MAG: HAMP domain-containing histidine kinase [Deltaproteobacteria bacterium]|nr:HAMP domain-containing histidine kinase [Deltaproteobacteria bacterium]MBI3294939.1 HAMP domain-containing histidine kinase [Deltaproteobacteria bacterium]
MKNIALQSWHLGRLTTTVFALATLFVVLQFSFHLFPIEPVRPFQNLAGDWEMAVPPFDVTVRPGSVLYRPLVYRRTTVPHDLDSSALGRFQGYLVYRRIFTPPEICRVSGSSCTLTLGEVGDSVEAYLNGKFVKRAGDFPPNYHYSKHYPVTVPLPWDQLLTTPNELSLIVYSPKKAQVGLRKGPVQIVSAQTAFQFVVSHVAKNVVIPILGASLLSLMACVLGIYLSGSFKDEPIIHAFIRYCFASAAFLLSFSEIPREYWPLRLAGSLHFALRIFMDWSLMELVRVYFRFPRWTRLGLRLPYLIPLAELLFLNFQPATGFDTAYWVMRYSFPLLILPVAMGVTGAYSSKSPYSRLFLVAFSIVFCLQLSDILVFHQIYSFQYFVKFYPPALGLLFMYVVSQERQKSLRELTVLQRETDQVEQFKQQAAGAAHDIRSPLLALNSIALTAQDRLPKEQHHLLITAIGRIRDLCLHMTRFSIGEEAALAAASAKEKPLPLSIRELIEPVIEEKRVQLTAKPGILIRWRGSPQNNVAAVRAAEFSRVLSNLLDNACEATESGVDTPNVVEVSIDSTGNRVNVSVRDNGRGVPQELLSRLTEYRFTHGKPGGTGLGLYHAHRAVESWGGEIQIESHLGRGTRVTLSIPRAELWD